jgi:hypothetical protein
MSREIERQLNKIKRDLTAEKLAEVAYDYFRDGKRASGVSGVGNFSGTPRDTGNARRNTKLTGDRILAQYPYAQRLDQGSSKQAPDGMSNPTTEYIKKYIDKYSKG